MAIVDSSIELNNLLEKWEKEFQNNSNSPSNLLEKLVNSLRNRFSIEPNHSFNLVLDFSLESRNCSKKRPKVT